MERRVTSSSSAISSPLGTPLKFATILPEWAGEIAVCVGSGPSLCQEDCLLLAASDAPHSIVVNDACRLVPWASVLYAPDAQWWKTADDLAFRFPRMLTLDPAAQDYQRYQYHPIDLLNYRSGDGLSLDPTTVKTGGHGGYQAINLAVHYRPRRIVLLGYDMCASADGSHHFFGNRADGSHVNYDAHLGAYYTLIKPLAKLGIEIVNASRVSAINAFPRVSLADALAG